MPKDSKICCKFSCEFLALCKFWSVLFLYTSASIGVDCGGDCYVTAEAPVTRKVGSIADYDPGATPTLNSAYQPVGVASSRQRQEWEETVPMSSSASCTCCANSTCR